MTDTRNPAIEFGAAGPGAAPFHPERTPYDLDPRDFPSAGSWEEQMAFLLRYATLAPSSHNIQPWKFRITPDGVEVYADYSRRLKVCDPDSRELVMSVGAAVFNLRVAASYFGFCSEVAVNEKDSELPMATVRLWSGHHCSPEDLVLKQFLTVIPRRHTNRHPFLEARVATSVVESLRAVHEGPNASLIVTTEPKLNEAVAELVARGDREQYRKTEFRKELAGWVRPNRSGKPDGIPGSAFGLNDVAARVGPWATRTLDLGGVMAKKDRVLCREAPALAVITSEDCVTGWIESGQLMEHFLLEVTMQGLHYSFFNLAIEVPDLRTELRRLLDLPAWPQLLLRVGYSFSETAPTPRRPLGDVIVPRPEMDGQR